MNKKNTRPNILKDIVPIMNPLIEKFLTSRGITEQLWKEYNSSEHKPLKNIDVLCEHLHKIHDSQSKIVIVPDYDMDGISSGITGYAGFSVLGFNVSLFVLDPKDGYGFRQEQIDKLLEQYPDTKAIITCDTGISCYDGTLYAKEKGLEVLITDHHQEDIKTTIRDIADVVVNPCLLDEEYEHPQICGAHVLWQVLDYYARKYGNEKDVEHIWWLRLFAGIGTVSDIMPLLYENRQLVKDSIYIMKQIWKISDSFLKNIEETPQAYVQVFRGMYAIIEKFQEQGMLPVNVDDADEIFYGFYLAPTFNSEKRLEEDLNSVFDIFTKKKPASKIDYLINLNTQRKNIVNKFYSKMQEQYHEYAPYVYITDAPSGILGLLATKITQDTQMPVIVVNRNDIDNTLNGSGRSPEWYPLLSNTKHLDNYMAGHESAFGCSFESENKLKELFDYLNTDVDELISEYGLENLQGKAYDLVISMDEDADTDIDTDLFLDFLDELQDYKPFGKGFTEPVFKLEFEAEDAQWLTLGKDKNHLKIRIPKRYYSKTYANYYNDSDEYFDVLCWNQAYRLDNGTPHGKITLHGRLDINEFRGERKAQFIGDIIES